MLEDYYLEKKRYEELKKCIKENSERYLKYKKELEELEKEVERDE